MTLPLENRSLASFLGLVFSPCRSLPSLQTAITVAPPLFRIRIHPLICLPSPRRAPQSEHLPRWFPFPFLCFVPTPSYFFPCNLISRHAGLRLCSSPFMSSPPKFPPVFPLTCLFGRRSLFWHHLRPPDCPFPPQASFSTCFSPSSSPASHRHPTLQID